MEINIFTISYILSGISIIFTILLMLAYTYTWDKKIIKIMKYLAPSEEQILTYPSESKIREIYFCIIVFLILGCVPLVNILVSAVLVVWGISYILIHIVANYIYKKLTNIRIRDNK